MKKVLVIEAKRTTKEQEYNYRERLRKYSVISKGTLSFDMVYHEDIIIAYETNKKPNVSISGFENIIFDIIFIKSSKYYPEEISSYAAIFKNSGSRLIENYTDMSVGSKLYPLTIASLNNKNHPKSVFFTKEHIKAHGCDDLLSIMGQLPLVLKGIAGAFGKNVYLINNKQELLKKISEETNSSFLLQEYIPSDYTLRIVTLGKKISCAEQRYVTKQEDGTFLNKGGNTTTKEIPIDIKTLSPELIKEVEELSVKLNRNMCGFDYLIDKRTNKPCIIEANSYPGFNPDTDQGENFVRYLQGL